MSKQQHVDARLDGYQGPFFPEAIEELQLVIDNSSSLNGLSLAVIMQTMPDFISMEHRPTTQDGYRWFWSLRFQQDESIVMVMLPRYQDWSQRDGSQADRSIAVHTTGEYEEEAASSLLERLMLGIIDSMTSKVMLPTN